MMAPRLFGIVVLTLALTAGAVSAADGFDGIVRTLERDYDAERTKIPFMGLANVVLKVARPYGVSGFKIAVFEDLDLTRKEEKRFFRTVASGVGKRWTPMIRRHSANSGELSAIYVRRSGGKMNMLLANYEPGEATIIQIRVDPETFSQWIRIPITIGGRMRGGDVPNDRYARRSPPREDEENMEGY